jgi:RNA polymerase sigma-70 factor (ECF subfamily)
MEQPVETPAADLKAVSPELRDAVDRAFRAYEGRLFHAALRITRNDQDAWDAVQEGLVSALRNADRFRGDAAVASWMYSIVVNAALYQRRRASARRRGRERYEERVWPDAERSLEAGTSLRDPEGYVLARLELSRVLERLEGLPEDRRALLEKSLEGESCATLAEALGQPVAAVKSRLWRARVALRETSLPLAA